MYNPLIPEPGPLCSTVFIELTSDEQMRDGESVVLSAATVAELRGDLNPDANG